MPMVNWHSARVQSPDLFIQKTIRTLTLPGGNIQKIRGKLKSNPGGGMKDQAIRFKASVYSPSEAKKWLKEHGYTNYKFEKVKSKNEKKTSKKAAKKKKKKVCKADLAALMSLSDSVELLTEVTAMAEQNKTNETPKEELPLQDQVTLDVFGPNAILPGDFKATIKEVNPSVNWFVPDGKSPDAPLLEQVEETPADKTTPQDEQKQ